MAVNLTNALNLAWEMNLVVALCLFMAAERRRSDIRASVVRVQQLTQYLFSRQR